MPIAPLLEAPNRLFGWSMTDLTLYGAQPNSGLGYVNAAIAPAGDLPDFGPVNEQASGSVASDGAVEQPPATSAPGFAPSAPEPVSGSVAAVAPPAASLAVPTQFSPPDTSSPVSTGSGSAVATPLPQFSIQPSGVSPAVDQALASIGGNGGGVAPPAGVSETLAALTGANLNLLHAASPIEALSGGLASATGGIVVPLVEQVAVPVAVPTAELVGDTLGLASSLVAPVVAGTGHVVGEVLAGTGEVATTAAAPVADVVLPLADDVTAGVTDTLAPAIVGLGSTIEEAGSTLAPVTAPVLDGVAPAAQAVAGAAAPLAEASASVVAPVAESVAQATAPVTEAAEGVVGGITAPVAAVTAPVLDTAAPLVATAAPAVEGVEDTAAPVESVVAPLVEAAAPVAEAAAPVTEAAAAVAAPLAGIAAPLTDALASQDSGHTVVTASSPSMDVAELGGSDPAGGIETLVGMVSSGDAFELSGPTTGNVVLSTGPSIMDSLADEIADGGSLLGGGHHDEAAGLFGHHDHIGGA